MSLKKTTPERHRIILENLLKQNENRYCADCHDKAPRWASWNLGIFICLRCAGIHRNLGVHISRVRSVNLDVWNEEQIAVANAESSVKSKSKKLSKQKDKKGKSSSRDVEKKLTTKTRTTKKDLSSGSNTASDDDSQSKTTQGQSSVRVIEGDLLGDLTEVVQTNSEHSAVNLLAESSSLQYLDGLEISELNLDESSDIKYSSQSSSTSNLFRPSDKHILQTSDISTGTNLTAKPKYNQASVSMATLSAGQSASDDNNTISKSCTGQTLSTELWQ